MALITPARGNQMYNLLANPILSTEKETFRDAIIGMIGLNRAPIAQRKLMQYLEQMVKDGIQDDATIYDRARTYVHDVLYKSDEWVKLQEALAAKSQTTKADVRALLRVRELIPLIQGELPRLTPMKSYLDVGCSEGSITAALGGYFVSSAGLPADQIYGCDVTPMDVDPASFKFTLIDPNDPHVLPYESSSQSVVSAVMMLHHVSKPELMLEEMSRVMIPDGMLIIREHDAISPSFSILLDVMHAFYMLVWPEEKEADTFSTYYAQYRTRDGWRRMLETAGFVFRTGSDVKGPWRYYYEVYMKPTARGSIPYRVSEISIADSKPSHVLLAITPWKSTQDMKKLEMMVRDIKHPGILWEASTIEGPTFGISTLLIDMRLDERIVSMDEIQDKLIGLDEFISAVEIRMWNRMIQ